AAALRARLLPYRCSWFHIGGKTRWLPLHLAHPGVWPSLGILRSLRHLRDSDRSAATFIEERGYLGRALELAQLVLTAHLPGNANEIGVHGLVADGVLHLEGGLNHRVLDGYDLLPQHLAAGLDVRFGVRAAKVAWAGWR
ncbi:MAG TPA: hypothetical protein VED59_07855, partial [Acidimicrobiales bacterium]|nr:hypothetical protein [Acidimicrobiales bacterium]